MARLLEVLSILSTLPEGASLAQLSQLTGTPKTSLLALLRALTSTGHLEHADLIYMLGPESFALGLAIAAQRRFPRVIRPVLEKLADACGETVLVAELARNRQEVVYIDKIESTRAVRFIANVGERRPLYASSGGRILLAFQSATFQADYLDSVHIKPLNEKKPIRIAQLREILREARDTGVTRTEEDVNEGVAGFAAPIFEENGNIAAALVIGAPLQRGIRERDQLSAQVVEFAAEASRIMGYRDGLPNL